MNLSGVYVCVRVRDAFSHLFHRCYAIYLYDSSFFFVLLVFFLLCFYFSNLFYEWIKYSSIFDPLIYMQITTIICNILFTFDCDGKLKLEIVQICKYL